MPNLKIAPELVHKAYELCKKIYENKLSKKEAIVILSKKYGMNETTADFFFYNFPCLLEGKKYTKTFNNYSIDYFLKNILKDYPKYFKNALFSLAQHIDYYEGVSRYNSKMKEHRVILNKYEEIAKVNIDNIEENGIEKFIDKIKDKNELIRLLNESPSKSGKIEVNGCAYKRDFLNIQILKKLRNYKCQICGSSIKMANGKLYVEGAHIKPKSKGGFEKPDNILILCPNHHKEFDLGIKRILEYDSEIVKFKLNGSTYKLSIKL